MRTLFTALLKLSAFPKKLILLGVLGMFPAFTAIASEQLLQDFRYTVEPSKVNQNIAYALMEENAAIVIDVRTKEEYESDHIEGAYNFPLEKLASFKELEILKEADTPVLLYCRSGRRSGIAAEQLAKSGYKYLMNFGGVITWEYGFTKEVPSKPFSEAVKEVKPLKYAY